MHALQYEPAEQKVYRTAVRLAAEQPDGFDAAQLAARIGCTVPEAHRWLRWLQQTGDFTAPVAQSAEAR